VLECGPEDVGPVVEKLEADPERVEQIRRRNVVNALRRHDCVYRWAEVLAAVGLGETPALAERRRQLAELAIAIERGGPAGLRAAPPP
jgi:hypothetical protein